MKTRIVKVGITISLITSSLLYATNGDNLISVGAKSRGMGGSGIAINYQKPHNHL